MLGNIERVDTSVVDYLTGQGWSYRLTNKQSERYTGRCPAGNHEGDSTDPKFSIHANGYWFNCWKCGLQGAGVTSLKKQMGQEWEPRVSLPTRGPAPAKKRKELQGVTLSQVSQAKGLPIEVLREQGWRDTVYGGNVKAVAVPWPQGTHYRVNLAGGDKYRWAKGVSAKAGMYGADRIDGIRAVGWALIVEGETDVIAGQMMGLPVLGVPGAKTWDPEVATSLLQGMSIYVMQEPDQGGDALAAAVGATFPNSYSITPPPGIKDLCELLDQCGSPENGRELFDWIKEQAEPCAHLGCDHDRQAVKVIPPGMPEYLKKMMRHWVPEGDCRRAHKIVERTAQKYGKQVNLISSVYYHRQEILEVAEKNAEFYPIENLNNTGVKLCIFLDNPALMISHEQLETLVAGSLGDTDLHDCDVPVAKALRDCGRGGQNKCDNHGDQSPFLNQCKLSFDPNCPTQAAAKVSKVKLANLKGDESYYHVVFQTVDAIPDNQDKWGPVYGKQIDAWQKVISQATRWKASQGRLLARAHTTYYTIRDGQNVAVTSWKAMFREDGEGSLSRVVGKIASAIGGEVVDERRYQSSQTALLQVTADFMANFLGIDARIEQKAQYAIFLGHYNATYRRHACQCYGLLLKLESALPKPQPLTCPVEGCGLVLRQVLDPVPPKRAPRGEIRYHNDGGGDGLLLAAD